MTDPTTDLLVFDGGEVKSLGEFKFGGYAVAYGNANKTDISSYRDFMTEDTDFWVDEENWSSASVPVIFNHGLDPEMKAMRLGRATFERRSAGIWAEGILRARKGYEAKFAEHIKEIQALIESKSLGLSTGVPGHLVEREKAGNAHWLKSWPIERGELSLTPTPAEPRLLAVSLKSLMDTAGSGLTEYDRAKAPEPQTKKCPQCGAEMPAGSDVCPKCGYKVKAADAKSVDPGDFPALESHIEDRLRSSLRIDETQLNSGDGHTSPPPSESSPDDLAVAVKSLVDRSARLVADLDELVPLWERAHAARSSEGRDLSPEKQATIKSLADRLQKLTVAVKTVEPTFDRTLLNLAFDEAAELNGLLAQLSRAR